jgi:hypothetical protein
MKDSCSTSHLTGKQVLFLLIFESTSSPACGILSVLELHLSGKHIISYLYV